MPVVSENNITKTEKPKEEKSKKELKEKKSIRKLKAQQENLECLKSEKSRRDVLEEGGIKMPQSDCLKKAKQQEAAGLAKVPRKGSGPEAEKAETQARLKKRKNSCTKGHHVFFTFFLILKALLESSKIHLFSSIKHSSGKENEMGFLKAGTRTGRKFM